MIKKIKGFSDLFPPEIDKYLFIEDTARKIFPLYNFKEMRIPILEKTELYARSIGDVTDVVQKEMFSFEDRKGRMLSLRPEATAGVVRAYIENKIYAKESVSKFFTIGPMFRYERPQKGRQRQFHQVNVEVFGSSSPYVDGEVICMLMEFLDELTIKDVVLEINSLGCFSCRKKYLDALKGFLYELEDSELCDDCRIRREKNPLRVLDCKSSNCQKKYESAPMILDFICDECKRHFLVVQDTLKKHNIDFVINKRLVRGLDYYQKTTFEVVASGIGAQSAIAGGGRYDGLIKQLGGPDIPGIGFACGMERLVQLISYEHDPKIDFYVAPMEEDALEIAFDISLKLRSMEFKTECLYEPKSPKAHLRFADKIGARFVILIGDEELKNKTVSVKNLEQGTQVSVRVDDIFSGEFDFLK